MYLSFASLPVKIQSYLKDGDKERPGYERLRQLNFNSSETREVGKCLDENTANNIQKSSFQDQIMSSLCTFLAEAGKRP